MDFNKPLEMPRGTHYGNNYYMVYSQKLHRVVTLFSTLEYYNFLSLEMNSDVEKFCEQPLKIEIIQDGKVKHAIFDMWVRYKDGTEEFQEVKYSAEVEGEDEGSIRSQEQIRRERAWCESNNVQFGLRTEKDIIKGRFFVQNLNVIAARVRRYVPTEDAYYTPVIINILSAKKSMKIEDLINNNCLPINNELNHICYLYFNGTIDMNIATKIFDRKTEVTLCQAK